MERPAIDARLAPVFRSQRASSKLQPTERSHDATILLTWACIAIAAIIAISTLTLSRQVHPTDFATVVGHPEGATSPCID
jgi:hypothetical protein